MSAVRIGIPVGVALAVSVGVGVVEGVIVGEAMFVEVGVGVVVPVAVMTGVSTMGVADKMIGTGEGGMVPSTGYVGSG